ncbi:MAG: hypothetical protein GC185_04040 [Alphaproteobacteria bacterium]|nr:hypothetical protein [Alphaproteobacteria bacterium]
MNIRSKFFATAAACALALGMSASAQAAGFYIQEQSVAGQGAAFAGVQANAQDASVLFNNPAAITSLDGPVATVGVSLLLPYSSMKNTGSTTGNDGGNPFDPTPVPSLYFATPLKNDRYWVGVSLTAPFGLSNDYGNTWFGRYDSTKSELQTYDISPVFSMKINDHLSIGGGPDIQFANATLESAVNAAAPPGSPATDLHSKLDGDSVTAGYNIGLLWKINNNDKVGLHYRSAITQNLGGTASLTNAAGGAIATYPYAAHAKLKLPDIVELGGSHKVNDKLTLLGSFDWFGWQNFDNITVTDDTGVHAASVTTEAYRNSFAVALGATWKQNDRWTYRGGFQFDRTPTTNFARTTRVADGDRYWLSLGAGYKLNAATSIDLAATHIFVRDGNISRTAPGAAPPGTSLTTSAKASSHIDLISASVSYKF